MHEKKLNWLFVIIKQIFYFICMIDNYCVVNYCFELQNLKIDTNVKF